MMFPTTVLLFCSLVAAFQRREGALNLVVKFVATGLAAWAAIYAAAYWGVTP